MGDLLPRQDQETPLGAEQGVQRPDAGDELVIGDDQELVSMLAIPAHYRVRRRIAVRIDRVRVGVAAVPV